MLGKYAERVRRLGSGALAALCEDLELEVTGVSPRRVLAALEGGGLCSADVVLVLLQRGLLRQAEAVAGCRIVRLRPYVPLHPPARALPRPRQGDDRRLVRVQRPNPVPATNGARARYSLLRQGMTVAQALGRGVGRRDLRAWRARGWVAVEGEDA